MAPDRPSTPLLPDVEALIDRLEPAVEPLRHCRDLAGRLRDELAAFAASIDAPRRAAGNIDTLAQVIGIIVRVCGVLKPFPVVGSLAGTIESVLSKTIKPPLDAAASALRNADQALMKPVDGELRRLRPVFEALEEALHELAEVLDELIATLKVTRAVADVIWGLSVISGNPRAHAEVERILAGYNGAARQAMDAADAFGGQLSSFQGAAEQARKLVPPVTEFLGSAAAVIFNPVNAALNHLAGLRGICETARDLLKPFEWVLGWAKWVIDNTIGWLIDKILNALGLRALVKALERKLKELLGLDRIERFLADMSGKFEGIGKELFQGIVDPRDKLVELKDRIQAETRSFASARVQEELRALARVLLEDEPERAPA